jgi:hypothetical protein
MIIAPTLILLTLAIASFSAGGYSMFQQYLQQTFSDSISDKAQVHSSDCRNHFFALQQANGVLAKQEGLQYISNNCADILNTTLVKQLLFPPLKHVTQNFPEPAQNLDWNIVLSSLDFPFLSVSC